MADADPNNSEINRHPNAPAVLLPNMKTSTSENMLQADSMNSGDPYTSDKGRGFVGAATLKSPVVRMRPEASTRTANRPKGLRPVSLRSICKLLLAAAIVGWIFLLIIAFFALAVAHTVRRVLQQTRCHRRFRISRQEAAG